MTSKLRALTIISALGAGVFLTACPGKLKIGCGGPMVGNEPTSVMMVFHNVNNPADADTALYTAFGAMTSFSRAHVTLSANTSYHVQVYFLNLNAAVNSASYDMTPGVQKESSSYLVCFNNTVNFYGNLANDLTWTAEDLDISTPKALPLDLTDSFRTGADSCFGILTTTLHHQWKVKTGDCDPGSIDIQASDTIYISPAKG